MNKSKNINNKLILVIDDEESILEIMQIVLSQEGYEVILRNTPPKSDEILALNPSLIFLDLLLKGENGSEVCIKLKAHPKLKKIPVILLSAHTKKKLEDAVKESGADSYLSKPFDVDVLIAVVKKYIR